MKHKVNLLNDFRDDPLPPLPPKWPQKFDYFLFITMIVCACYLLHWYVKQ